MKIKLSGDLLTTGPGTPRLWMTPHQVMLLMPLTQDREKSIFYSLAFDDVALDSKRAER